MLYTEGEFGPKNIYRPTRVEILRYHYLAQIGSTSKEIGKRLANPSKIIGALSLGALASASVLPYPSPVTAEQESCTFFPDEGYWRLDENRDWLPCDNPEGSPSEEEQVLNFPGPNATDAEKKAHSDLVNKLGSESVGVAYLDISGCKPTPVVYRVELGGTFKVKNSDQEDHTIYHTRRVTIKANSEQIIEGNAFAVYGLGNYGYGCDTSLSVGVIQLIPSHIPTIIPSLTPRPQPTVTPVPSATPKRNS